MAYGLIFTAACRRGVDTNMQLAILKRDYEGEALQIGNFQSLNLNINESNEAIDAPIHKSTLTFSMADAPDMPDTETTKYSGWELFYTSDPTLYRVMLLQDLVPVWEGYVTPDSWEGDLVYHNTVTITCRDNIGRLSDIKFDKSHLSSTSIQDGMVRVQDVLWAAFTQAKVAMPLDFDMVHELTYGGQTMRWWAIDASSLRDKTYQDILEGLLSSMGLCIRYFGNSKITLCSLRDLPLMGHTAAQDVPVKVPQFLNRSGHFALNPGYKAVREVCQFEAPEATIDTFKEGDFSGMKFSKDLWSTQDLVKPYGSTGPDIKSFQMRNQWDNTVLSGYGWTERTINVSNRTKVNVSLDLNLLGPVTSIFFRFMWKTGSITYYWDFVNQGWTTAYKYGAESSSSFLSTSLSLDIVTPDGGGQLVFGFQAAETNYWPDDTPEMEDWSIVSNFTVQVDESSFPKQANITTHYNEDNSLILDRRTDYGQAPQWMHSAGSIGNAFYKWDPTNHFPPIKNAAWNDKSTFLPIAVQVHMELLALHCKPNYQLTGDLRVLDSVEGPIGCLWEIYGRRFFPLSGSYDCLTGFFNSAVLVEFDDWEEIFGSVSADFDYTDDTYVPSKGSSTNITIEGGGGGGGGGITLAELEAYLTANHYINNLSASDIQKALGFVPANAASVPSKVSQLTNDSGFITRAQADESYHPKGEVPIMVGQLINDVGYVEKTQADAWYQPKGQGGDSNIFVAAFDDTTFAEVVSHIAQGHDVVVRDEQSGRGDYAVWHLVYGGDPDGDKVYFSRNTPEGSNQLCWVNHDDSWEFESAPSSAGKIALSAYLTCSGNNISIQSQMSQTGMKINSATRSNSGRYTINLNASAAGKCITITPVVSSFCVAQLIASPGTALSLSFRSASTTYVTPTGFSILIMETS